MHFSAYADPEALAEADELRNLLPAATTELERSLGMSRRRSARPARRARAVS